jgi:hypothetical protein
MDVDLDLPPQGKNQTEAANKKHDNLHALHPFSSS